MKKSRSQQSGSALLITLLVVSLLMILVMSFVVFVRMELRQVIQRQHELTARKNARLGLVLALGELQRHAGADQRITAPATTAYPEKDELWSAYRAEARTAVRDTYLTPSERQAFDERINDWWEGRNPRWTGVWDSSLRAASAVNSDQYGEFDRDQEPIWLISGNEGKSPGDADMITPDTPLPDPAPGNDTIWLVGEGSAFRAPDQNNDGLEGWVKAPLTEHPDAAGASSRYAYWVADESVKANFSVRDRTADPDDTGYPNEIGSTTREYRNRLQSPQRVGWERIRGFSTLFDTGTTSLQANDDNIAKVASAAQIGLLDPLFDGPVGEDSLLRSSFHTLTADSASVLSDTALGGLRKDLTRYLEDGDGLNDSDPILDPGLYSAGDPRFGPTNTGFPRSTTHVPEWRQLRWWYNNEATGSSGGNVSVNRETAPVLTYLRFHLAFTFDAGKIQLHWLPVVTLWNPYDAGLQNTSYTLRVRTNWNFWSFGVATAGKVDPTPGNLNDGFERNGYYVHRLRPAGFESDHSIFNNLWDAGADRPRYQLSPWNGRDNWYKNNIDDPRATWITFNLSTSFDPGEARVFTVGAPQEVDPSDPEVTLINDFEPDFPASFYFDVAEFVQPAGGTTLPVSGDTVRFYGNALPNFTTTNAIKLSANGQELWEHFEYGLIQGWQNNPRYGSQYSPGPYAEPEDPSTWRRVYEHGNWRIRQKSGEPQDQEFPVFAFHEAYLQPFSIRAWKLDSDEGISKYFRAFGSFNINAPRLEAPQDLEGGRAEHKRNNTDGFTRFYFTGGSVLRGGNNNSLDWDGPTEKIVDTSSGTARGFALVTHMDEDTLGNRGLSQLSTRLVKRSNSEVLSLARFQQVNLSPFVWQPAYPIGNAEASPYVDREYVAGIARTVGAANGSYGTFEDRPPRPFPNDSDNRYLDLSYLLNESLWDRYYLSSIPSTGAVDLTNQTPLPNGRLAFRTPASIESPSLSNFDTSDVRDVDHAAFYQLNRGALNINSTSVEAWKALFGAFRDLVIEGDGTENPEETFPVSRSLNPLEGRVDFTYSDKDENTFGATGSNRDYSRVLSGFRYLTDNMIEQLAERIVDEIRLRGPFYSLSDFINRRLVAPDTSGGAWSQARSQTDPSVSLPDNNPGTISGTYNPLIGITGLNGTLQRAINVSGINGGVNYLDEDLSPIANPNVNDRAFRISDAPVSSSGNINLSEVGGNPMMILSELRHYLDSEHLAGTPAGERGHLLSHAPGFVTQGDLLAMVGSALTARGDTFVIRAYGDFTPPGQETPNARAWLEAVVQRIPDPVHPSSGNPNEPAPDDPYGRRFRILRIKWLLPEDV